MILLKDRKLALINNNRYNSSIINSNSSSPHNTRIMSKVFKQSAIKVVLCLNLRLFLPINKGKFQMSKK